MNMTFAIITPSVGQIHSNMITLAANMTGFRLLVAISLVTGANCYKSHMLDLLEQEEMNEVAELTSVNEPKEKESQWILVTKKTKYQNTKNP